MDSTMDNIESTETNEVPEGKTRQIGSSGFRLVLGAITIIAMAFGILIWKESQPEPVTAVKARANRMPVQSSPTNASTTTNPVAVPKQ